MLPKMIGEFRVGNDPEFRFTPSGAAVCTISVIADARRQKDNGEWETTAETGWLRCTAWNAMAERVNEEVTKGAKVYLVGRFKQRKYTIEGDERTSIELDLDAIEVVPDRNQTQGGSNTQGQRAQSVPQDDEPPF